MKRILSFILHHPILSSLLWRGRERCFLFLFLLPSFGGAGGGFLYAQLPVCSGIGSGMVYYITNVNTIYNYDPSIPISASNPSLNTITPPNGAGGLAVSENLNTISPSPTFYTVGSNDNYYYYNGSAWVNTGHSAGGNNNIGGGGLYL